MTAKEFTAFAKAALKTALGAEAYVRGEWTGSSGIVWARFPLGNDTFGYWTLQRRYLRELRAEAAISRGERNPGELFASTKPGLKGYRVPVCDIAAVDDWWPAESADQVHSSTTALLEALK